MIYLVPVHDSATYIVSWLYAYAEIFISTYTYMCMKYVSFMELLESMDVETKYYASQHV